MHTSFGTRDRDKWGPVSNAPGGGYARTVESEWIRCFAKRRRPTWLASHILCTRQTALTSRNH
jgi:hypothetical protein